MLVQERAQTPGRLVARPSQAAADGLLDQVLAVSELLRLCWATKLPWGEDAFAAWQRGPVTVLAGHNLFKFAPVLGRLLVEAARSGPTPRELGVPAG